MDGDDVYTNRTYLIPLNCTCKMAKIVSFMLHVFYYSR